MSSQRTAELKRRFRGSRPSQCSYPTSSGTPSLHICRECVTIVIVMGWPQVKNKTRPWDFISRALDAGVVSALTQNFALLSTSPTLIDPRDRSCTLSRVSTLLISGYRIFPDHSRVRLLRTMAALLPPKPCWNLRSRHSTTRKRILRRPRPTRNYRSLPTWCLSPCACSLYTESRVPIPASTANRLKTM